ncbi:L-threonylcarbamoyladenylate synthase [Neisseria sp. 23W00296]|uniref:L-threonylcarbamoyladenylate synthase n=1 Tax=unclassified Neisseria TaxID=2623750 RepID=UPI0003483C46|nr:MULTISPECIES: L-threonylcarbamoyladenylate synthase [unclassified Neisseria]ASP17221.1 Sua5/YciO/YrdC/YwlC family protein [Neisseria sp. KEM232]
MKRTLSAAEKGRLKTHLRRGGLIAYPTESCYGLGCLPRHAKALRTLVRLKRRPQHKGMIVIGDSLARLRPLLRPLPESDAAALHDIWPARETFLLPAAPGLPPLLRGKGRGKLAVRVPAHAAARDLCRLLGTPLVSTSCNRAGKRPCRSERETRRQFGRSARIVGGRCGQSKTPSRITDWATGKRLR